MKRRVARSKDRLDLIIRDLGDVSCATRKVTIRGSVLKEEGGKNNKTKVEGKHY